MKTKYGHTVPENAIILAENNRYCVWAWEDWLFLDGLAETRFAFTTETEWNEFVNVITEANKTISGGVKL